VIYFDHNATTPLHPEARRAWLEAADRFPGNPSSPHRLGSRADHALDESREKLATFLGCHATQIVFTSGATEANNTVLHHYARTLPADTEIWTSAIEHPSVLEPSGFQFGPRRRLIPVERDGMVSCDWLEREFKRSRPGLIAVMAANNETGVLQPWREVLALCREREVPLFCDAVQWMGKLPADDLGHCDWVSGSAHKFGGPRGVGFLKVPENVLFVPLLRGGPQEERRRAGTENVPGVLAMIAALEAQAARLASGANVEAEAARKKFEQRLIELLPGTEIVGTESPRLWNTVSAVMPEADCPQRWVVKLDKIGIAVSTGSACSSGKEEPSHVLRAMGFSHGEAGRALRFSAGRETTADDWQRLLDALQKVRRDLAIPEKTLAKTSSIE
jgi:cysteine desulfurase